MERSECYPPPPRIYGFKVQHRPAVSTFGLPGPSEAERQRTREERLFRRAMLEQSGWDGYLHEQPAGPEEGEFDDWLMEATVQLGDEPPPPSPEDGALSAEEVAANYRRIVQEERVQLKLLEQSAYTAREAQLKLERIALDKQSLYESTHN
eukprot:TRINITY_DN28169_c0_g1_i1.p1 TRINITY_DN28169_c0_g1~~TRINITY_DN28169_c0_g1_i1.p1  ORF type:complete len:151 (+),score=18.66 TRINITY_DN28169_c0_g1_i1:219-671(+)